jgi:hypothetical protein
MKRFLRLYGFILATAGLPLTLAVGFASGGEFAVGAAISIGAAAVTAGVTIGSD